MKSLWSVLVLLSISTMSFAQIAMNTSTDMAKEPNKTVLSEKAIARLAAQQTQQITAQLSNAISTKVAYSDILTENAIEGDLLLKVTFTTDGEISSLQIRESPHALISTLVIDVMDAVGLKDLGNVPYYGPEAMIIPVSFSLR